jgi:hypothetical protein
MRIEQGRSEPSSRTGKEQMIATMGVRIGMALAAAAAVWPAGADAQQRVQIPTADRMLTSRPAPVHTVGRAEGADHEILGVVGAIAFDARDNLYILDRQASRIVVYDAAGRYLRIIGRSGGGPGEFTMPLAMAITTDQRLVVADAGRQTFSIFDLDGTYRTSVPFPTERGMPIGPMAADSEGGIVLRTGMRMPTPGAPFQVQTGGTTSPLFRFAVTEQATPRDLFSFPMPTPVVTATDGGSRITMGGSTTRMFDPQPRWGALPGSAAAVASDAAYRIQVIDGSGRVQRTIERNIAPRRVTRADQERARELRRTSLSNSTVQRITGTATGGNIAFGGGGGGGGGMPPEFIEEQIRAMQFAEVIPVIEQLRADPQGRIWVQRAGLQVGERGPIDLIDASGRYIGTLRDVRLPDAVSASGLAAWAETDEFDVPRVAVRRLPADWR